MEYSIAELSKLTGISTRTLRYYDQINLLKPSRITDAGYRYYESKELSLLQQILFYRERGFDLKTIKKIIYERDFDMLKAMEEHLTELENQKAATEALIHTVKNTIRHLKGEYHMSEKEMFQSLKDKRLQENEQTYGAEAREKYGNEQVDASNRRMKNMTDEQWEHYLFLENEILSLLEKAVTEGTKVDSSMAQHITELHKEWLQAVIPQYTAQMHKGIASMYVADERFTAYYDRNVKGCAQFLKDAVHRWM